MSEETIMTLFAVVFAVMFITLALVELVSAVRDARECNTHTPRVCTAHTTHTPRVCVHRAQCVIKARATRAYNAVHGTNYDSYTWVYIAQMQDELDAQDAAQ